MKTNLLLFVAALTLLVSSCKKDDCLCKEETPEAVNVKLDAGFGITKDLFEFVTPIITYMDCRGVHSFEVTPNMCEEQSKELSSGHIYSRYYYGWKLEGKYVPGKDYDVKLTYVQNQGAKPNIDKRYYFDEGLGIYGCDYKYNGMRYLNTFVGISISMNFNPIAGITNNEPNDGLLGGQNVEEYIKQLCSTEKSITVKLNKDGKLNVGIMK